ncbi:MAG: glycosyltransferase [bacterium]|nr:glycosyltransferase [bacterium]
MEKKLKIGFAGNTNNYPYTLAIAFSKLGHDVKFLIDSTEKLHRPENRFILASKVFINTIDLSPLSFNYWEETDRDKIRKCRSFFADRDVIILNSDFVSMSTEFNRPHIVLLTGSDLDFLASEKYVEEFKNQIKKKFQTKYSNLWVYFAEKISYCIPASTKYYLFYSNSMLVKYVGLTILFKKVRKQMCLQAEAIKRSPFLISFPRGLNKSGELVLKKLKATEKQRVFNLMTDVISVKNVPLVKHNNSVRIFNVARFNWHQATAPSTFTEMDFKGNDVMINGIALFVKQFPNAQIEVVFVRKGENLKETYDLIRNLGLEAIITWKDELSQAQVLEEYEKADIVFDQFTTSLVGMGGLDALAVGRPLIANWRPEFFEQYEGKWPVCQATNVEEVFDWLKELVFNENRRIEIGKKGREFVEKKLSSEAFANRILQALVLNKSLSN